MEFACLDFVNSEWTDWRGAGPATDRLSSPVWWTRFLKRWELGSPALGAPSGRRLVELRRLRQTMRKMIEGRRRPSPAEVAEMNRRLATAPQRWRIDSTFRTDVVPASPGWNAVTAALILSFGRLMTEAEAARLKRCANPDCSYVFYDTSTNRSRRWCFSNVCGNLMHVRTFRARND